MRQKLTCGSTIWPRKCGRTVAAHAAQKCAAFPLHTCPCTGCYFLVFCSQK